MALQTTQHLPNHQRLLKSCFRFFKDSKHLSGLFLKGGAASGLMGPFSGLEVGLLCKDNEARLQLFEFSDHWEICKTLRNLGSHQELYRTSFCSDKDIQFDLQLHTISDLPPTGEGPFVIAWDHSGDLDRWLQNLYEKKAVKENWSQVIDEDEKFWVWTHYSAMTAAQGEYHEVVYHLEEIREIVQKWQARLDRTHFKPEFLERMKKTFCPPHKHAIKEAFQNLIKIQLQQRSLIEKKFSPRWTVKSHTIARIQNLSQTLRP